MTLKAFAKLQYVDMGEREREEITLGLKKYCELDTLAMVMIYEHFREVGLRKLLLGCNFLLSRKT
jgi:hypothetical protein